MVKMMSGQLSSSVSGKLRSSKQYEVEDGGRSPARTTNSDYGSVETSAVLTSDMAKDNYSVGDSSALLSGDEISVDILSKTGAGTYAKKSYFLLALGAIMSVGISSFILMPPSSSTASEMKAISETLPTSEESIPLLTSGEIATVNSKSMRSKCDDYKTATAVGTGLGAALFSLFGGPTTFLPVAAAALMTAGNAFTNLWSCPGVTQESYDTYNGLSHADIKDIVNKNDAQDVVDSMQDIEANLNLEEGNLDKISLSILSKLNDRIETEVLLKAKDIPLLVRVPEIMIAAMLQYEAIMAHIIMRKSTYDCDFTPDECCDDLAGKLKLELDQLIGAFDGAHDAILEEAENGLDCTSNCRIYDYKKGIWMQWHECFYHAYPNEEEAMLVKPFVGLTMHSDYIRKRQCDNMDFWLKLPDFRKSVMDQFKSKSDALAWWRMSQSGLKSLRDLQSKSKEDLKKLCDRGLCSNANGLDCACSNDAMCGDKLRCIGGVCKECGTLPLQKDYRGSIAVTESGRTCQPWASQSPQKHVFTKEKYPDDGLDGNFCRNPSNNSGGTWCFTTDPEKRWEECSVPSCGECATCDKCGTFPMQKDYRGSIAVTVSGRTCQPWDSQMKEKYPDDGLDGNFCRNPSGHIFGTWCFTTDPEKPRENCSVPRCS